MNIIPEKSQTFIGTLPIEEYRSESPGHTHVSYPDRPVKVTLDDGTGHAFVGSWKRTDGEVIELGSHVFALSETGALHIVQSWHVTHAPDSSGTRETVMQEHVVITYAAGTWRWVTGPRGVLPDDETIKRDELKTRPEGGSLGDVLSD